MTLNEGISAVVWTAGIVGVSVAIVAGVATCANNRGAAACQTKWEEAYEWKYVASYCKIKVNGKWVPEDVLLDRKGAK